MGCKENSEHKLANWNYHFPLCPVFFYFTCHNSEAGWCIHNRKIILFFLVRPQKRSFYIFFQMILMKNFLHRNYHFWLINVSGKGEIKEDWKCGPITFTQREASMTNFLICGMISKLTMTTTFSVFEWALRKYDRAHLK